MQPQLFETQAPATLITYLRTTYPACHMLVRQGHMGPYDLHPLLAASTSLLIHICTAEYLIVA